MQEILSKKSLGYLLKILRIKNSHSQDFIAKILNVSRSNYSQIEIGNQYPTFESLHILASFYSKSYEWLLQGHGMPVLTNYEEKEKVDMKKPSMVDLQNEYGIVYVDQLAIKNYVSKRKDSAYLATLTKLSIPPAFKQNNRVYRAFIDGDVHHTNDVSKRDILIGKFIDSYYEILKGELYVLVTNTEVLTVKIESFSTECMHLHCKHEYNYGKRNVFVGDIEEIWEITGRYSGKINTTIENLENAMHSMEELIGKLESEVAAIYATIDTSKSKGQ